MTSTELEYAEKRMQQKWYELVMAEQKGVAVPVLERMYNAYILAVEEYNRCSDEYQRQHQEQPIPVPVKKKKSADSEATSRPGGRKKKAS